MSLKGFFAIFSSGDLLFKLTKTIGRGSPKEDFCEISLKSSHRPARECRLKIFLFLALVAILFRESEPF